jgi:TRAP-type C4-dicarboxylate transport system permease large subunit
MNPPEITKPLNPGLARTHGIFVIIYGLCLTVMIAAVFMGLYQDRNPTALLYGSLAIVFVGLLVTAHWHALKGAKYGKPYGRRWSKIIGVIWLFSFPVGTILGIYVLRKTSKTRWVGEDH